MRIVTAVTTKAQITRVSVAIVPAGVSADLTRDPSGTFSGTLSIPAGDQTVTASAWAGATLAASGTGSITVLKGQTAQLFINALDATGPAPLPDHSPVITSLSVPASAVTLGDAVALAATAIDADGDPMTFGWSVTPAGCGTFTAPDSTSTTWTAAALGTCTITVAASARGLSDLKSASILVSGSRQATPTLVQHLSSSANPEGFAETGNNFSFTLPNKVQPGNCLILAIAYDAASPPTSITDNNGNIWPAATVAVDDGAGTGHVATAIYVLPNAIIGPSPQVETITVNFSTNVAGFQYTCSEFSNIATSSPVDAVASGNPTAPTLSTGTMTTREEGDLIWYYASDNGDTFGNAVTQFTAGTGFTLLDADIAWGQNLPTSGQAGQPHASQYQIQAKHGAITPSMTAEQSTNDGFLVVAVALKAASAGSSPPAQGIYVNRISHLTTDGAPATYSLQFPSSGNLIVLTTNEPNSVNITGIADNKGNSWTSVIPDTDVPQLWYAANAETGPDLRLALNISGTPATFSVLLYDVLHASASPFDVAASDLGGNTNGTATVLNQPSITPTSPNGLTIVAMKLGIGPTSSFADGTPADAFFDVVYYSNQTDGSKMDNSDGRAHFYNADLTQESFNWNVLNGGPAPTNGGADSSYSSIAVHFNAAPIVN